MLHSGVPFVSASRPYDYRVSYVGDGDSNLGPHTCKARMSPQGTISPVLIFFCLVRRQLVSGDLIDDVQEWVMHMCLHSCSSVYILFCFLDVFNLIRKMLFSSVLCLCFLRNSSQCVYGGV